MYFENGGIEDEEDSVCKIILKIILIRMIILKIENYLKIENILKMGEWRMRRMACAK